MESIITKASKGDFCLIAEIGVNYYDIAHNMNLTLMDAAKFMIDEAKKAGVHAVKFQTYKAEKLASKYSPYYWDLSEEATTSQFELFKKYDLFGYKEYEEISNYCNSINIEFYSTPFDFESADYLDSIMNIYKISSSDINNLPFIEHIAKKNKPILLSVGASNEDEIDTAIGLIKKYNDQPIVIMHCVLEYPTIYEHANLNKITALKKKYNKLLIGYSDHTKPDSTYDVIKTAYNLGAIVVEKHFTIDRSLKGNDHYHAMDSDDAVNIIKSIAFLKKIRGSDNICCLDSEITARKNARRSIVSLGKIEAGEIITMKNITFKRPGLGISPDMIDAILGKKVKCDIVDDTILSFDMFSD